MSIITPEMAAKTEYYDDTFHRPAIKISPGEFMVAKDGELLVTMLASCISTCLRDTRTGIGGMNHFAIPNVEAKPGTPAYKPGIVTPVYDMRNGIVAMDTLISEMIKVGAKPGSIEAHVFGASEIIQAFTHGISGRLNMAFVMDYMKRNFIPIKTTDFGGQNARKIYFFPHDGKIIVKSISRLNNDTMIRREQAYINALMKAAM